MPIAARPTMRASPARVPPRRSAPVTIGVAPTPPVTPPTPPPIASGQPSRTSPATAATTAGTVTATIARGTSAVVSTPSAVPIPTITPIQYHVPTSGQCSDGGFSQPPTGDTAISPRERRMMLDEARPLLVFFSSSRSGPARRMESLLAHVARKERHRLRVIQVDVDQRRDLAQRLDIAEAPALVLVVGKRAVARLEGRTSAPRIDALLNAHLAEPVEV